MLKIYNKLEKSHNCKLKATFIIIRLTFITSLPLKYRAAPFVLQGGHDLINNTWNIMHNNVFLVIIGFKEKKWRKKTQIPSYFFPVSTKLIKHLFRKLLYELIYGLFLHKNFYEIYFRNKKQYIVKSPQT
jgi:hypothetical protein